MCIRDRIYTVPISEFFSILSRSIISTASVIAAIPLSINYIFSNFHVGLLSCGNGATNLHVYYTIDSPGGQCCGALAPFVPGGAVLAEHLVQTAFNLFFSCFLFLRGKYRRKTFQHNVFPLKRYGLGFFVISNGLYHSSLLFKAGCIGQQFPSCPVGKHQRATPAKVPPFELSPASGQLGPRSAWDNVTE